jgi:hypothetical protein
MEPKTAAELLAEAERLIAAVRSGFILPEDRTAIVDALVVDFGAAYGQASEICEKDVAIELCRELEEIMRGLTAQIELTAPGDLRLKIICNSLQAAINALKARPQSGREP